MRHRAPLPDPAANREEPGQADQAADDQPDRDEQPDRPERRLRRIEVDRRRARVAPRELHAAFGRPVGDEPVRRSALAVVLERDLEDLAIHARPRLRVEGDLEADLVGVGVVEVPADVVDRVRRVRDDRDRAGRPVGAGEPLVQLARREREGVRDVLPVDGALDEPDGDRANLPLLGGGEHVGLRVLRDELRLPGLEDLLLRMPGVLEVDADEGDAARDRQADREPSGPAAEPAGPQQPHRPRIRPHSGGGICRLAV